MLVGYRRSRIICGFILLYIITYSILRMLFKKTSNETYKNEELVKWKPAETELSCHVTRMDNDLPLLHRNASLPEKSIFFHETTCIGGLTSRQACAVESAAKAHPQHQINVLFTSPVQVYTSHGSYLKKLADNYKNVKLARILLNDYADGTPIESTVKKILTNNLDMHISKIVKYLTLYNYSGIYLGWDVIVARSFDELWKNWAVRETSATMSSQMFSFSKNKAGRKLAQLALGFVISELSNMREHDFWSYKGPNVMTHVLQHWCSTSRIQVMNLATCEDLAVYGPELFYPISFYERQAYFNGSNWTAWKDKRIFTYFTWRDFTKYNLIAKASLYQKIAMEYCPVVYSIYGNSFEFFYT